MKIAADPTASGGYCAISTTGSIVCFGGISTPLSAGTAQDVSVDRYGTVCGVTSLGKLSCTPSNGVVFYSPAATYSNVSISDHTICGLTTSGNIECVDPHYLGNGLDNEVPRSTTFLAVDVSLRGGCAVRTNGQVVCWGDATSSPPPVDAAFKSVSVEGGYACGVTNDNREVCWGELARNIMQAP